MMELETPNDLNPVVLNQTIESMDESEVEVLADDVRDEIENRAGRELQRFMNVMTRHLEEKLERSRDERENRDFLTRIDRARARVNNKARVWTDSKGKINPWSKDAHLELGFTQGWSAQAAKTAAANISRTVFDQSERFFMYSSIGKRQENKGLKESLTDLQDYLLRKGKFEECFRRLLASLPVDGTKALRFDAYKPLKFERNPETGVFEEKLGDLTPCYINWPIEHIFLTDWDKPRAQDQEGVFWVTPNTTLQRLLPNKATFDFNTSGVNPSIRLKSGRFVNLKAFEEAESEHVNLSGARMSQTYGEDVSISSFPQFDLIEYEGALPMAKWVEDGDFTWEMAMFFGLDVGVPRFGPEDKAARREFGRRLNQITHYQVSWATPDHTRSGACALVEFAPSRWLEPSNSLFWFQYDLNGDEALGNSITDLIWKLEDAGDALRNAQVRIIQNNARPPKLVSKRALKKPTMDEVNRMWEPDSLVEIKGNPNVKDIFDMVLLPEPHRLEDAIARLKIEAEITSGITQAAKTGQSTGGTATEANLEEQKSQTKMEDAAIRTVVELFRLIEFQTKQTFNFLGREGFVDLIKKISGRAADEVDEMVGPGDEVWEEFDLIFPPTFGRDKAVIAEAMRRDFQTFPGVYDPLETAKIVGQLSGYPHIEEALAAGYKPIDIDEEHRQMAMGNYVKPVFDQSNPQDFMQRFIAHTQMLQLATTGQVMYPPENVEALIFGLENYLRQAAVFITGMQVYQGMQSSGSPAKPGPNEQGVPANQQQAATQLSNQAGPQFGGSQANLMGAQR